MSNKYKKNGPPTKDMTIPAGNSYGAASVRPSKSQTNTNRLPSSALHGSNNLASFPNSRLAIWGTINPIKLKSPAKLTTQPAITLDRIKKIQRVTDTFTPKERAISSPRFKIFKCFAKKKETITANTIPLPGMMRFFIVTPDSVPIVKVVIFKVTSELSNLIVFIPAFKNVETVMPARIIVVLELSDRYANAKISIVVINAPPNAKNGR